jgi:protein-arginine kinase activator protein McsA
VIPLLRKIHGHSRQGGAPHEPTPATLPTAINIQAQIQEAIREENFEKAAELRDKLKNLRTKNG